jgi:hypothetical protein
MAAGKVSSLSSPCSRSQRTRSILCCENLALSDGDDNRRSKPSGDDTEDGEAPSVEKIAPNPIGSSAPEQVHSSTVDQVDPVSS